MAAGRRRGLLACAAGALLWTATASAQSLGLTTDAEVGFRRVIRMAQTGQLGDDVTNANVAIAHDHVRLELVRAAGGRQMFLLTRAADTTAGYFAVAPGAGAGAGDAARVGSALRAAFRHDPFQVVGLEESYAGAPIPGLVDAWSDGGWRGVVRACERWLMVPASLGYTIGVIAVLALATLASLAVLWGSTPPRAARDQLTGGARRR
jgi:hypothetical protein